MNHFVYNVLLAFVWAFSMGELTLGQLLTGFALGYLVLCASRNLIGCGGYCRRVIMLLRFVGFFLWQIVKTNLRVAYEVLTPTHYMRPGILAMPLDAKTDLEITLLANLISLTPGTLSLDISPDRRFLFVHSMYIRDFEQEKRALKDGFERRLLEILR